MVLRELEITTDPGRIDLDLVHRFLSGSYWASGRSRDVVERSIRNSLCFSAFHGSKQVAFARVITDRAVLAYIADVFVVPECRGVGIGKALIRAILDHPELQGVQITMLRTRDAGSLYAQFGFQPLRLPEEVMALYRESEAQ